METIKLKIKRYEEIILSLLEEEMSNWHNESPREIVLADKEKHHYQLILTGWNEHRRFLNDVLVHFHLAEDGKIWLLENNTEWLVAEALVQRGIPKHEIVIAFHPPQFRQYTGYAVA